MKPNYRNLIILLFFYIVNIQTFAQSFVDSQLKNARVKVAKAETDTTVKSLFSQQGLSFPSNKIFIRIFKAESILELWAENPKTKQFVMIKTYPVCAMSGVLGGKNRIGDYQVPEGFYVINAYNPNSNYHLSVQINYPNAYDSFWKKTGGAICIHGYCASAGCIAITDDPIKELYWIIINAKSAGQSQIPVHIFPTQLSDAKLAALKYANATETEITSFWDMIKIGYDYFETHRKLPTVTVVKGKYVFE
jgi:murein L,D-transpeptidase YafK